MQPGDEANHRGSELLLDRDCARVLVPVCLNAVITSSSQSIKENTQPAIKSSPADTASSVSRVSTSWRNPSRTVSLHALPGGGRGKGNAFATGARGRTLPGAAVTGPGPAAPPAAAAREEPVPMFAGTSGRRAEERADEPETELPAAAWYGLAYWPSILEKPRAT
eukprot:391193-Rhodomonas_salina.1